MKKWVIISIFFWGLLGLSNVYVKDWAALTAIATWILAASVFFAISQVYEARKSTNARIAMDLFRELRSEEAVEKVRFIYSLKTGDDMKALCNVDLRSIEYILDRLDVLSVLVEKRLVDDKLAIDAYAGVTALRCWYILYQYIYKVREKRKYFGDNFEAFTNRCITYFDKEHIQVGFDNPYATEENLVEKLRPAEKEGDKSKRNLYPRTLKEIRKQREPKA